MTWTLKQVHCRASRAANWQCMSSEYGRSHLRAPASCGSSPGFKAAEITMLIWAFAVTGQRCPEMSVPLPFSLRSLGAIRRQHFGLMSEIGSKAQNGTCQYQHDMRSTYWQVAKRAEKFTPSQLAHVTWAFGALGMRPRMHVAVFVPWTSPFLVTGNQTCARKWPCVLSRSLAASPSLTRAVTQRCKEQQGRLHGPRCRVDEQNVKGRAPLFFVRSGADRMGLCNGGRLSLPADRRFHGSI